MLFLRGFMEITRQMDYEIPWALILARYVDLEIDLSMFFFLQAKIVLSSPKFWTIQELASQASG